jgi:hypothetical protein
MEGDNDDDDNDNDNDNDDGEVMVHRKVTQVGPSGHTTYGQRLEEIYRRYAGSAEGSTSRAHGWKESTDVETGLPFLNTGLSRLAVYRLDLRTGKVDVFTPFLALSEFQPVL